MFRTRTTRPESGEVEQAKDQAAKPVPVPEDLAAAQLEEEIARDQAAAQAELDEIQRQREDLEARAKAVSSAAGAERTAKQHRLQGIKKRDSLRELATQVRGQAEEAEAEAAGYAAERDRLMEKISGFDGRLAGLQADGVQAEADWVLARDAEDVDAMLGARRRADDARNRVTVLSGLRAATQERATEVGDGTGAGLLAAALRAASDARAELRRVENLIDPARPEAVEDQAREVVLDGLQALKARITEDAKPAPPRPVVYL